jgi:PKD repeat protein
MFLMNTRSVHLALKLQNLFFVGLFLFTSILFGQSEFYRQYNNVYESNGRCLAQLSDSGYVVAGQFTNPSYRDRTLTRLDKFGNIIWEKVVVVPSSHQYSNAIKVTSNNRILVVGYSGSGISFTHFDIDGNILANKFLNLSLSGASGNYKFEIIETPDQNIYVLARNYIIKTDSNGNNVWIKQYNLSLAEFTNIHYVSSNKFIITGNANNILGVNSFNDIVQVCIDSIGVVQWAKAFGREKQFGETARNSILTFDNKIITFGKYDDSGSFILATDTNGEQLWCKGDYYDINTFDPIVLNEGSIVAVGISTIDGEINLFKWMSNGELISRFSIQNPSSLTSIAGVTSTNDNGFYFESQTTTLNSQRIGIKVDASFSSSCVQTTVLANSAQTSRKLDEVVILNVPVNNYSTSTNVSATLGSLTTNSISICAPSCDVITSFAPGQTKSCVNSSILFTNSSLNATSFKWFVNDSLVSNMFDFNHMFNDTGIYMVKLVGTGVSCSDSSFCQVEIQSLPTPNFNYTKNNLKVLFEPIVSSNLLEWDCGDSSSVDLNRGSFTHYYKSLGDYSVCLKESNICGSNQLCKNITLATDEYSEFLRYYRQNTNNQYGASIYPSADGGYYHVGTDDTYGSTGWKGLIVKTDKYGSPINTTIVNFPNDFQLKNIIEAYNGDLILSGNNFNAPASIYFGRINPSYLAGFNNTFISISSNTNEPVAKPIELKNGDLIFSGSRSNLGFVMQTDANLNIKWYKRFNKFKNIYSVLEVDSGFLLVGRDPLNQLTVMKINHDSQLIWINTYNLGGISSAYDIIESKDGDFLITGYTTISSKTSAIILKLLPDGSPLWCNSYVSPTVNFSGSSITENKTGNLFISASGSNYNNTRVFQTDSIGSLLWAYKFTNIGIMSHAKTQDGGVVISGTNQYNGSVSFRPVIIKLLNNQPPSCLGINDVITKNNIIPTLSNASGTVDTIAPNFSRYNSSINYSTTDTLICFSSSSQITADFTYNNNCSQSPIIFSDNSLGNIESWYWTFSNGNPQSSTSQNPTVLWDSSGIYEVTLTIMSLTDTLSVSKYINVIDSPIADFTHHIDPSDSLNMLITNNATGSNLNYNWDFGDGSSSTLIHPSHIYAGIGVYNVCLTITDSLSGCFSVFCDSTTTQRSNGIISLNVVPPITTNVSEINDFSENIYPNPFSNSFTIEFKNANSNSEVYIFTIDGKIVFQSSFKNRIAVNTSRWSKGVYLVKVIGDIHQSTQKLFKN